MKFEYSMSSLPQSCVLFLRNSVPGSETSWTHYIISSHAAKSRPAPTSGFSIAEQKVTFIEMAAGSNAETAMLKLAQRKVNAKKM